MAYIQVLGAAGTVTGSKTSHQHVYIRAHVAALEQFRIKPIPMNCCDGWGLAAKSRRSLIWCTLNRMRAELLRKTFFSNLGWQVKIACWVEKIALP